jgi:hypothetical protein
VQLFFRKALYDSKPCYTLEMKKLFMYAVCVVVIGVVILVWVKSREPEHSYESVTETYLESGNNSEYDKPVTENNFSYGNAIITTDDSYRFIVSNGLPEHETGPFPTRGNPNTIREQDHSYRVTRNPIKTDVITSTRISGVALNGIPFEPNTAETYDVNDDWAIEAFDANGVGGLGIDWSNAHVQPNGTYHYHAAPEGLLAEALKDQSGDMIQVGWAADGFPIYFSQSNKYSSSWKVRAGSRPTGAPRGEHDGTYSQDFEFKEKSGDLDQCNGVVVDREYIYIITNTFPYVQRCVFGTPDQSFDRTLQNNRGLPGSLNNNRAMFPNSN